MRRKICVRRKQTPCIEKRRRTVTYDDLDHLAGTWSQEEAASFAENTAVFEKVDENLWK